MSDSQETQVEFETAIQKEQVNELPLIRYEGPITLVRKDEDVAAAVASLREERLLGFDTETRPSFRKGQNFPTALLQLCGEKQVFLFQLLQLENLEPVLDILRDPDILKVGVAIRDDLRKLEEEHGLRHAGFQELADFTQQAGVVNTGLRSLAAIFLKFRISKNAQVSNWARKSLSEAQLQYAATDAWVSREIYLKLQELGLTNLPREQARQDS